MFNYLYEKENEFCWENTILKSNNPSLFEYKITLLKQMFVPFGPQSFSESKRRALIENIKYDLVYIFINFTSIMKGIIDNLPIIEILIFQLLSPIIIPLALDLSITLTLLLLSFITRSIATIFYMIDYLIDSLFAPPSNGVTNETILDFDNIPLEPVSPV